MSQLEPISAPVAEAPLPTQRQRLLRWLVPALVVIGTLCAYTLLPLKDWLVSIAIELRDLGFVSVFIYLGSYILLSLIALPAALLSITAGVTWGVWAGFLVALPSAVTAATVGFSLSRYWFSGHFRRWLMKKPKLAAIERAVARRGAPLIFFMRLSPALPFPILNYVFGLSSVSAKGFVTATALGLMPITLLWTYVGSIGAALGGLDGPEEEGVKMAKLIIGGVGALATIIVTIWVGRIAKRALAEVEQP